MSRLLFGTVLLLRHWSGMKAGAFGEAAKMTDTYCYRGYEIVPTCQWASWCVSIYTTRADLPLLTRSTLRTLASGKEEAVAEAKQSIDHFLARLDHRRGC